jgi:hypothetical protein
MVAFIVPLWPSKFSKIGNGFLREIVILNIKTNIVKSV